MFYDQGLKFSCQMCRYCCSAEPGYVYLSEQEIFDIAQYLSLPIDQFMKIYCRAIDFGDVWQISLREKENYDCIFLTENGCSVYPVRPHQCSQYPFWKNIMESREAWENEKQYCPGIGKGDLIPKKEIEKRMKDGDMPLMILKRK